jgi:uncharacterized OB-fold protein
MLDAYEREAMILDAIDAQLAKLRERYKRRARVVKCVKCGRYFVAFRREAKYCSQQCRQMAYRERIVKRRRL